ncbi:glucose-6-phosphate dehydrogenase [uncultured Paludibaculum sp.]|uniref:glucose-6-phosphate dehydrogenase n=1 Tax=uncultured Paludibaculum sp. TaxID=1765020 RepID=UPI002AABAECE|nr:glucose-6-phosphate dehydrogenase [uncultured Paludibaculum sp.]
MAHTPSDALVFFGATGDLAYKKIFPALQAMVKRGSLHVPIVGVAKSDWNLEQFQARALDSLEKHGGVDRAAFQTLRNLLRYVDGDYNDPATFEAIRRELGTCERPAYYLAIPPSLFGLVVRQLGHSGCAQGARVVLEKPFGTDLASARRLNEILHGTFDESAILRIDHYLGKRPVHNMIYSRFANSFLESFWNRTHVESVQLTMAEDFGVQGRGGFYDQTGAIRDVVQNHLFQIMTNLAMDPPVRADSESIRDEKVKVLRAIPPLEIGNIVRGQFRGYRSEKGVSPTSQTETFAAIKLEVNSWRWQGVPFYIRAGKCLPVTCTEVVLRLKRPPSVFLSSDIRPNHFRFRISPDVTFGLGMMVKAHCDELRGESQEMLLMREERADDMGAYERLLRDAMAGDPTLFAREDYVEEAWRIVDPVLNAGGPVCDYEPGTWGPDDACAHIVPPDGWHDPTITTAQAAAHAA